MSALKGIAACRRVEGQRRVPGYLLGYHCRQCGAALQVSPTAAPRLDSGELAPLCPDCALPMALRLEKVGANVQIDATRDAFAQLTDPRVPPMYQRFMAQMFRSHLTRCAHCGAMVASSEAATHVCEEKKP